MDDIPILFKHVDFFDRLDRLDIQLLKRSLQFLVVCARRLVDFLYFSPGGAFASVEIVQEGLAQRWMRNI